MSTPEENKELPKKLNRKMRRVLMSKKKGPPQAPKGMTTHRRKRP
jgi:hypothetical protein